MFTDSMNQKAFSNGCSGVEIFRTRFVAILTGYDKKGSYIVQS